MLHQRHPIKPHHKTHQTPSYVTNFIATLLPIAQSVKKQWGVPIAVLIAQGALESGWGRDVKGNAYFGIKGNSTGGTSANFATHEVVNGQTIMVHDDFRAYASLAEAADDHGRQLRTSSRFRNCFAYSANPDLFVYTLAKDGYASDAEYATKLRRIIRGHGVARYDQPAAHK